MTIRRIFILLSVLTVVLGSCRKDIQIDDESLRKSLDRAGNNRNELMTVLNHYKDNPEKLAAAEYLIINMKGHYGYDGWELDSLDSFLKTFDGKNEVIYLDSINLQKWSNISFYQLPRKEDLRNIKADYLIKNIDHAFKRWKDKSWNKNLSFDDFCELILPFCIGDDRLTDWREAYSNRYEQWLDDTYKGNNSIEAAMLLCDTLLKEGWAYNDQLQTPHRDATALLDSRVGYNRDICDRLLYAFRACGIPATIDIALNSQDKKTTYQWITVKDNSTGEFVVFDPEQMIKDKDNISSLPWSLGKVYRLTYASQDDRMDKIRDIKSLPLRLNNIFLKDVTSDYFGDNKVTVRVRLEPEQPVFLGVWNQTEWRIDDSGDLTAEKTATFTNIEPEVIFVPVKLDGSNFVPCGHGFFYGQDSIVHILKPDTLSVQKAMLYKTMNMSELSEDESELVTPGDDYELFYMDGSRGWKSLGTKRAEQESIDFVIPSNSLLMLKNVTRGTGGQMFIYRNSQQLFSKDSLNNSL